jgi:hypothetical protein
VLIGTCSLRRPIWLALVGSSHVEKETTRTRRKDFIIRYR